MRSTPWFALLLGGVLTLLTVTALMYRDKIKYTATLIYYRYTSTFTEEQYQSARYRLGKPDASTTKDNDRKFPLVVYLHGAGARGNDNLKQIVGLDYLGNGKNGFAKHFRKDYPCYVYVPQCPRNEVWEGDALKRAMDTMDHLLSIYPIDRNRIYLIGYSMGGTGVYSLAAGYHKLNDALIAAIIRIAGQTDFNDEVHAIISKTAVWLHIGLKDTPNRVETVRKAYNTLREQLNNPPEKYRASASGGTVAQTSYLIVHGINRIQLTEYPHQGHGIGRLPFSDPQTLNWLFSQNS